MADTNSELQLAAHRQMVRAQTAEQTRICATL